VLCISPAFHHDFDCHEKSPAHCPACMASPAAEYARVKSPAAAPSLGEGEDPPPLRASVVAALLVGSLKDRSPPASRQ
jgi:hypothetical protein